MRSSAPGRRADLLGGGQHLGQVEHLRHLARISRRARCRAPSSSTRSAYAAAEVDARAAPPAARAAQVGRRDQHQRRAARGVSPAATSRSAALPRAAPRGRSRAAAGRRRDAAAARDVAPAAPPAPPSPPSLRWRPARPRRADRDRAGRRRPRRRRPTAPSPPRWSTAAGPGTGPVPALEQRAGDGAAGRGRGRRTRLGTARPPAPRSPAIPRHTAGSNGGGTAVSRACRLGRRRLGGRFLGGRLGGRRRRIVGQAVVTGQVLAHRLTDLVGRYLLVHNGAPRSARQPEPALRDQVALDLVRPAGDVQAQVRPARTATRGTSRLCRGRRCGPHRSATRRPMRSMASTSMSLLADPATPRSGPQSAGARAASAWLASTLAVIVRHLLAHDRVLAAAGCAPPARRAADRMCGDSGPSPGHHRLALAAQAGPGDGPAAAGLADPVGVAHPHLVEEDLVEGGAAGHLPQRPDGHAGRPHVDQEHRQARVLGRRRIGPDQKFADVGDVSGRGPDLLPGDDPVLAVAARGRPGGREVRSR